jgi:dnaG: DNA primase
MRYSDDIIEEVRQKNDIVDVVSQYVKLTRKGSSYFGLCPFHNEKTPSFSVTPGKQMYYCFGCGAGGNVFNFIMEYENYSFGEALKHLADRAGVELPKIEYSREVREKAEQKAELLEINKQAAQYYYYQLRTEGGRQGHEYLAGRQLSEETMRKFGLGYSDKFGSGLYKYLKSKGYSDERLRESGLFNVDERHGMYDKFWNRVIFPIMDVNNRVIGFGGRVMGDGKPKYLNSPETKIFDKSRNLYGLNIARTTRKKYLILCEGYMDVISMHQAGFTNAVASLGTALTSGHASLLKRYTQEVLLLYDSDEAGIRAALRGIPILREAGVNSRVVDLKPYKDPDEFIKNMGAEAFEERLNQASDSFMFRVSIAESEFPMEEPQGQNRFFERCAEMLLELKDELERNLYIEAIVKKYRGQYGVSTEDLRKRVNTLALKGTPAENRIQPKSGSQNKRKKRPLQSRHRN